MLFRISFLLIALFSFKACRNGEVKAQEPAMVFVEQLEWRPSPAENFLASTEKSFDVESILPDGYVKDGSVDYTAHIQEAIFKHPNLKFPPFPIKINDKGLKIGSNQTITFPEGSELRLEPTTEGKYAVLEIRNAENVKIFNPVIIGDRDNHLGSTGEWGMGIRIVSSKNIEIYNPKVSKCWGDGLYIAGHPDHGPSRNVKIVNAYCRDNRRNGISVISVDGLKLISPYSGYNDGIDPKSGIDIEPNRPTDQIRNIEVVNPQTEYNPGTGISIGINKLYGSGNQQINIEVQQHIDYGSMNAFLISCANKYSRMGERVSGTINITDPVWKYNANAALSVFKFREPALYLNVTDPKVTDIAGKNLSKEAFKQTVEAKMGSNSKYMIK
ncbi:MAG TPA: hypothetical protein VGE26_11900 [Sphingobacteriaceae bacterium]